MTGSEKNEIEEVLKTDVLGRVRVSPERREEILDAFEASGMSGQAFALHHGIKVQTFASWIQKRRRMRGDYEDEATRRKLGMPAKSKKSKAGTEPVSPVSPVSPAKPTSLKSLNLIELQVRPDSEEASALPLEIVLPGGAVVKLSSQCQIGLLKTLFRELPC